MRVPEAPTRQSKAVKLLIELGDSATAIDTNGDAALHGAVMRNSTELVRLLLDHGAALNPVNDKGWTPLTIAQDVFYANLGDGSRKWSDCCSVWARWGQALCPLRKGSRI